MTPEQHRRVRDLFEQAIDHEPLADAPAWVAHEAAADPLVRDEVLSLLDHHSRAGKFLSEPIVDARSLLLADDEPLAPGTRVGEYSVIRELGRGGMGRVYLVADARLGRTVALKALAPHLLRDPANRERLRREARAAATLTHPGICTVYALEEIDGDLYIASEFIDGVTLGDEIRSGRRPSAEEILQTGRDLAAALASAHAHGVIHRDLKPDNVMRARDGRLKILDFGLARADRPDGTPRSSAVHAGPWRESGRLTTAGVVVGTPAYMAPEQINGEPGSARTDVFAFGILLYEFACGVHPFHAATSLATMARILESDARPYEALRPPASEAVADVVARCLCKDPAERFGSAGEIVTALESGSVAPLMARVTMRWWRSHQLVIMGLYVLAAAAGWRIKAWSETPFNVSIFVALGASAAVGGVLRGHLVFTEWMNGENLPGERRRTARPMLALDLAMSVLLLVDGIGVAATRALPAVFTIGLAIGIALAATVLEPATTVATFGAGRATRR